MQEALSNVRRHSNASEVSIIVKYTPEHLEIIVQDNGKGFYLDKTINRLAAENKLGIIGMQQRVKVINGLFDIQSFPGEGTLVSIKIDLTPD